MRTEYSDRPLWYLLPPEPQPVRPLRRSNLVCIAMLAFFTLGLLVAGFVEANNHATQAAKAPPATAPAYHSAHHTPKPMGPAPERELRPN